MAVVLVKLARLLTETTKTVSELSDRVVPLLEDAAWPSTRPTAQLVAVEAIAMDVKQVSGHAAKVSDVTQTVVTGPLIKVSALGYGVRQALAARRRGRPTPGRWRGGGDDQAAVLPGPGRVLALWVMRKLQALHPNHVARRAVGGAAGARSR